MSKLKSILSRIRSDLHRVRTFDPMIMEWLNDKEEASHNWVNIGLMMFFVISGGIAGSVGNQITVLWLICFFLLVNYIGFRLSHKADQARMMIDYMAEEDRE